MLTGKPPFDPKELLQSGFDEMRRTIREKEPERPSTRLSTMLDVDLATVAQRRQPFALFEDYQTTQSRPADAGRFSSGALWPLLSL